MTWVFDHSPYVLGQRLIHLAIADVVNDDYDYRVFLGDAKIATKAKVDRKTVSRAKARMIADGYLEVIDDRRGPGKFSEYRFLMPDPGQNVPGSRDEPGTFPTPTGDISDPQPGTFPETVLLPTKEELKGTQTRDVVARAPGRTHEQEFDIIWAHYPRKLDRLGALEKFIATRRRGVEPRDLYHATRHYAESMMHREPEHILHGATFFGPKERWRDYLEGPLDEMTPLVPRRTGPGSNVPPLEDLAAQAWANQQREDTQ